MMHSVRYVVNYSFAEGNHPMEQSSSVFDPRSPAFRADPYSSYDALRAVAPVYYWDAWDIWFIARYDDCNTLLRDARLGRGDMGFEIPAEQRALFEMQGHWMLLKNPPDHTRLRGLVHKAFTPRIVEQMRDRIQAITDGLLDRVASGRHADLIADLAYPLPVTVIAELLGIPAHDHDQFHTWSDDLARSLDLTDDPEVYNRASRSAEALTEYLRETIARRRRKPQNDLLSALIAAEEGGGRLTEDELYATCALLLVAGHETTVNLIGNGMLALLRHPDQLRQLRAEPRLIKSAIEELLRYDSPVQLTGRVALADLDIRGQMIRAGQQVVFLLGSANHDPARFADPPSLDIRRDPNPHLAFGSGIHYCLGAPLARLESQIAIGGLLRRMPNLILATEAVMYRDNLTLRGLRALPVTF
jgi:pimeloyl-[acyl-carrier protein] synthase